MSSSPLNAVIAAHRFGLGEPSLRVVGSDPAGWLRAQIGPADPARGEGLLSSMESMRTYADSRNAVTRALLGPEAARKERPGKKNKEMNQEMKPADAMPMSGRELVNADVESRLLTAVNTKRPFAERLVLFWSNHFTVSADKGAVRGLAGALEREAIRPHIAGKFETMLRAAAIHPAMLRYLDNNKSMGPNSRAAKRGAKLAQEEEVPKKRLTGLNENLAREILELHTLGVADGGGVYGPWGGYTQADVTSFAKLLTGWRAEEGEKGADPVQFEGPRHEPGSKTVMGKTYPEGPKALDAILHDLAAHPNTARHVSAKLARHFVADQPPKALVDRLVATYQKTDGDLAAMYRTLIDAPESWDAAAGKLKTPEEFGISTLRLLGMNESIFGRKEPDGAIASMGQRTHYAPSPAGWPDMAEEWLGPEAMWKRVEWAMRVAKEMPPNAVDARALARESLGPRLSDTTAKQIERAADGQQAVVLLLLSPEFQRR